MTAYYNERDPFAAAWLREIIKAGHIAPGDVDERSIEDVTPNDVAPYTQVHLFAGIGGWSYALRLAGWPDDQPVWTGSAPCQPFSTAGKGGGFADERHLWPAFFWLIRQCQPHTIFGEQVSSKGGLEWLDVVSADLEASGYGVGAFDLCAAGAGAFHIRQRLYFVAHATGKGDRQIPIRQRRSQQTTPDISGSGRFSDLANTKRLRQQDEGIQPANGRKKSQSEGETSGLGSSGTSSHVGNSQSQLLERFRDSRQQKPSPRQQEKEFEGAGFGGFWSDGQWLQCSDGKARPVKPGILPLAHGVSNRVGTLRGSGNAIVPQIAAQFISAYMEATCD